MPVGNNRRPRALRILSVTLGVGCLALASLTGCAAQEAVEDAGLPDDTGPVAAATATAAQLPRAGAEEELRVVFLGDSLTAGYGLSEEQAYPALIAERIAERGWPVRVVNAGVSGDTSAGGLRRIDWLLEQRIDVLMLALGANDGLRGFSVDQTRANLQGTVDKALAANPRTRIVVAGMVMPPNLGPDYTAAFQATFPALAAENNLPLVQFLLAGVAGEEELNQPDGIHPTAAGQRIVADTVWSTLEPLLEDLLRSQDGP
jgi:acyl-CoA thioesterase-1